MQNITLDITPFEEKISLHSYLKEQLELPFYYGANLDALFDELTSMTDTLLITLRHAEKPQGVMEEYLPLLLAVFRDAMRDNYNLAVVFEAV